LFDLSGKVAVVTGGNPSMSVDLMLPAAEKIVLKQSARPGCRTPNRGWTEAGAVTQSICTSSFDCHRSRVPVLAIAAHIPSAAIDVSRPMLPAAEKIVLVLGGIGDDKIRVNSSEA
jgi:hypothetical protein